MTVNKNAIELPLPEETARALEYAGFVPLRDFVVNGKVSGVRSPSDFVDSVEWDEEAAGQPAPTRGEVLGWASGSVQVGSQTFAEWKEEHHNADPVKTARRLAREHLNEGTGAALVDRAIANVGRAHENETRALVQGIIDAFTNNTSAGDIRAAIISLTGYQNLRISKAEYIDAVAADITAGESDAPI